MLRIKGKIAALSAMVMAFGLVASGCGLIEKSPEAIAKQNVARVGGEYITRAELDKEFESYMEQFKAMTGYDDNFFTSDDGKEIADTEKRNLLDTMVEKKLFRQKVKEFNLFKDENEMNEEAKKVVDDLIKMYGMTEEDFNKQMEQANMTREEFQEMAKDQAVIPQKLREYATKDVTVGDDEIKKYYDENKETLTEKPNTMEVSHILVGTEEEAKAAKDRLLKGEDFAAVAKEVSTDTVANEDGGSLGEIQYNDSRYDATFVQAAMALKEGEISDPVLTQFGYHIIKVTKKTEYPVLTLEAATDRIKNQLLTEKQDLKYQETVDEWKESADIKIYEKNISNTK